MKLAKAKEIINEKNAYFVWFTGDIKQETRFKDCFPDKGESEVGITDINEVKTLAHEFAEKTKGKYFNIKIKNQHGDIAPNTMTLNPYY